MCHIAFWEPQFAGEYATEEEWKKQPYRIAAKIHPLTVEQNAFTSFKSRTTLVPCRANTIGPGLFLQADYAIGGADGTLGRGMQWQGMSLWMTLRHGPTPWITSSYIPTLAGRLFFLKELPVIPKDTKAILSLNTKWAKRKQMSFMNAPKNGLFTANPSQFSMTRQRA
jgi:glucosamine-6-phosphate deaminase